MDYYLTTNFPGVYSPRSPIETEIPEHVQNVKRFVERHENFMKNLYYPSVQILRTFCECKLNEMLMNIFSVPCKSLGKVINIIKDYPQFEESFKNMG